MAFTSYSFYSTAPITASSSGANFQFGFLARYVRIENLGSVDLWAKYNATTTASTGDWHISTCTDHRMHELFLSGALSIDKVSIFATSTAAGASMVSLKAWG